MRTRVLLLDQAVGLWGAQRCVLRLLPLMSERNVALVLGAPPELELTGAWVASGGAYVPVELPVRRSVRVDGENGRLSPAALRNEAQVIWPTTVRIREAARTQACRIIHANGNGVHFEAALAGRTAGLRTVLHLHEEMPRLFGRALRSAAVSLATRSVAVSQALRDSLPAVLRQRVEVIRNGVDTDAFRPVPGDAKVRAALGAGCPNDLLVVALTRLDPSKRVQDIIAALGKLLDLPRWRLAIVGETSSYPEYEAEIRRQAGRQLGSRVTFCGRRTDAAAVLAASDLLVHAGVVEGMPLSLLEAQASGRPVVAYKVAGVSEAVRHGTDGLLAEAFNVQELADHLRTIISDDGLRRRMASAGRAHVREHHSLTAQADRYADLIDRLAFDSGLSPRPVTARRRVPSPPNPLQVAQDLHVRASKYRATARAESALITGAEK